jgi:S-adenosylmethionine:tRNA ribosyltransferase-isomerase
VERLEEHVMHSERYVVSEATTKRINAAKRVVAVGTTVTRVLEAIQLRIADLSFVASAEKDCGLRIEESEHRGETDIFIHPPYQFGVVGGLLTNFHLPESTLIMLVSAFAGRELVMEAYAKAVKERYRFYSYGDCCLFI